LCARPKEIENIDIDVFLKEMGGLAFNLIGKLFVELGYVFLSLRL
jgi:hypothetical protein